MVDLAKSLPPGWGAFFGHPVETAKPSKPMPPGNLPGAYNAPELCLVVEQYRADLLPRDPVAEVKIDGLRCLYIGGRLWTREGSPFEAAEHCLPILREVEAVYGQPMFFDGEYVEEAGVEATLASFRRRAGTGCLWLFDAVPLDQWMSGQPSRQMLWDRKAGLRPAIAQATQARQAAVGFIESLEIAGEHQVETAARELWSMGYEGLVIKSAGSRYVRKRTSDWMKVKLRTVSDMIVVDVLPCKRDGKDAAKAVLVRLPREGSTPIRVATPGGLGETIWRHRGNLIGERVQVEHAGFTAGGQPREAVLKQITL
jgi:ATP-dependent DNA ligase